MNIQSANLSLKIFVQIGEVDDSIGDNRRAKSIPVVLDRKAPLLLTRSGIQHVQDSTNIADIDIAAGHRRFRETKSSRFICPFPLPCRRINRNQVSFAKIEREKDGAVGDDRR